MGRWPPAFDVSVVPGCRVSFMAGMCRTDGDSNLRMLLMFGGHGVLLQRVPGGVGAGDTANFSPRG